MLDFCGKHNLTCDVEVRKKKYGSAPDGSPKPLLTLTVTHPNAIHLLHRWCPSTT